MAGEFVALGENGAKSYKARKKLKDYKIKVGDFVEVDEVLGVVERVLPRMNELVRPPIANVDIALIVVATVPSLDYILLDKLLIKFFSLGIEPVIVVNKMDLNDSGDFYNKIVAEYGNVTRVVGVSVFDGLKSFAPLIDLIKGKFAILTGQSAVGKTSILKVLLPNVNMEVGELSSKTARGKNTTRHSEIFVLENGGLIADTPGFSAFELDEFLPEEIIDFTPELKQFSGNCKYNNCNHIGEDEQICAVKRAVRSGGININRYNRFCELYKIAKEKENKKYE